MSVHPLHALAHASTRERIRSAIGVCTCDVDAELHADRITERVLQVRIPQLELIEELQTEARRIASLTMTDALQTEGSIS